MGTNFRKEANLAPSFTFEITEIPRLKANGTLGKCSAVSSHKTPPCEIVNEYMCTLSCEDKHSSILHAFLMTFRLFGYEGSTSKTALREDFSSNPLMNYLF